MNLPFFYMSNLVLLTRLFAPHFGVAINPGLITFIKSLSPFLLLIILLMDINWKIFMITFFGLLLSLNEANLFIRYFFEVLELVPLKSKQKAASEIDIREYNRGRVIGFLERSLIYFFVLGVHYSAIGFIVAAKGVTRFRELDDRKFAEYFLFGTLLLAVVAGIVALFIKYLIH